MKPVLQVVLLVLLVLGVLFAMFLVELSQWGGVLGDSAEEIEARTHWQAATEHEKAGRLDQALAEIQLAMQSGYYAHGTRRMADLLEAAGRFEEALEEIDRGGSSVSLGEYCDLRTDCLQQWKGTDAAVAWLHEMDQTRPDSPFFMDQLGSFHLFDGRPEQAIEPLLEATRRGLKRQMLAFDEDDQLVNQPGAPVHRVNDLCDLWPTLEYLCEAYERAGNDDLAFQYATREVSLGARIKRLKAYFGPRWQEAGSFTGRIVRARVLMRRGDLQAARQELEHAEEVKSNYSGWQKELDLGWAELQRLGGGGRPAGR